MQFISMGVLFTYGVKIVPVIHPLFFAFAIVLVVWMMALPISNLFVICLVSAALKIRFKKLNELLVINLKQLRIIANLHLQLLDVIPVVNHINAFLLVILIGSCLLQSTTAAYEMFGLFVASKNKITDQRFGFAMLITIFNSFLTSLFTITIFITSTAIRESRKSLGICYKMRKTLRNEKNLELLLLQLSHTRDIGFGCGLFTFDWSLAFNFITAIMSNLMIFIQFDVGLINDMTE
jgi:hypothetical protein